MARMSAPSTQPVAVWRAQHYLSAIFTDASRSSRVDPASDKNIYLIDMLLLANTIPLLNTRTHDVVEFQHTMKFTERRTIATEKY